MTDDRRSGRARTVSVKGILLLHFYFSQVHSGIIYIFTEFHQHMIQGPGEGGTRKRRFHIRLRYRFAWAVLALSATYPAA